MPLYTISKLYGCSTGKWYFHILVLDFGSPYLQHRAATLFSCNMVDAIRTIPQKKLFEVLSFSALFGPDCCCQLVCFEFDVLHFRLPLYTRNEHVGEHVFLSWFLALVLAGCCCQLVCFEFIVLHFRLPIPETRNGQIIEHVRTEKKQKRPCPAVQGTWLHVRPFLTGVLTQRFSTQPLELYIPRLSRCTTQ